MAHVIMIGCDLHDAKMILKIADGTGEPVSRSWATKDVSGLIDFLFAFADERGAERIVFAYEASGQGFGLHDQLTQAGIESHVLAPTHLPHTARTRKNKTDSNDALMLLDEVRGFVLAGRRLPDVWVPDQQTRCDRELVRARLEMAAQRTRTNKSGISSNVLVPAGKFVRFITVLSRSSASDSTLSREAEPDLLNRESHINWNFQTGLPKQETGRRRASPGWSRLLREKKSNMMSG